MYINKLVPAFGELYLASLPGGDSVQSGVRPVLITQNIVAGTTAEVLPLTSKLKALHLPTHVVVQPDTSNGLSCPSMILAEQVTTINIAALIKKLGCLQRKDLIKTGKARYAQSHFPVE